MLVNKSEHGNFSEQQANSTLHFAQLMFWLCLAVHLVFSFIGWNNTIVDHHGMRQTHTAMTSFYYIHDRFRLDYEVPILGKPSIIPREFPLYQGIVALVSKYLHSGLDQTGRAVSLFFFYAGLIVVFLLVRKLSASKACALLAAALVLSSPVYLFWSRTFLIESTALFFSLLYIYAVVLGVERERIGWMLLAGLAGAMAAMVKLPTQIVAMVVAAFLCMLWLAQRRRELMKGRTLGLALCSVLFYAVVPLAMGLLWTSYADAIKDQYGIGVTAQNMMSWHFGTMQQRFSGAFHRVPVAFLWAALVAGFAVLYYYAFSQRKYFTIFFLAFLLGPLVFANLYIRHGYYWYANTVYLCIALAVVAYQLLTNKAFSIILRWVIPAYIVLMCGIDAWRFFPGQFHDPGRLLVMSAKVVSENTQPEDIIFCYGLGFDPSLPYYAKRRSIMAIDETGPDNPEIALAVRRTGKENITALVVGNMMPTNDKVVQKIRNDFNLPKEVLTPDNNLKVYVR